MTPCHIVPNFLGHTDSLYQGSPLLHKYFRVFVIVVYAELTEDYAARHQAGLASESQQTTQLLHITQHAARTTPFFHTS